MFHVKRPEILTEEVLEHLTAEELAELDQLLEAADPIWSPLPGPQTDAYHHEAQVVGYGGAAGGGKTDLACGISVNEHQKVGIFRAVGTELTAVIDRFEELLGSRDGYNGQERIWRFQRKDGTPVQVEFGSFPHPGDEKKYRGRPHDLLVFDEACDIREEAMRFVSGWLRTVDKEQRCRILMCFNPPTTVEGRWVVRYFAPWLDENHPNPAAPGEIRWFVTVDKKDHEVDGPEPVEIDGKLRTPQSRTFIPSRVRDNPYLAGTNYEAHLDSLPEPLRSQMRDGDFSAGMEDDPWQVIPSAWVKLAVERWKEQHVLPPMDSMGVDVAQGGEDDTVISRRHGMWFDELVYHTGRECTDGPTTAGFVVARVRDRTPIHIDTMGVGAAPYGHLMAADQQAVSVNFGEPSFYASKDGNILMFNLRSELWWKMREALDPAANTGIALPPDQRLIGDLCTPKWCVQGAKIKVQSREEIVKELGRSPDAGTAVILALMDTMKAGAARALLRGRRRQDYDPFARLR